METKSGGDDNDEDAELFEIEVRSMMADAGPSGPREPSREPPDGMVAVSTSDLLAELARRFRIRFGRLEIVFHDGRPSPRVLVEHRLQRTLDEPER